MCRIELSEGDPLILNSTDIGNTIELPLAEPVLMSSVKAIIGLNPVDSATGAAREVVDKFTDPVLGELLLSYEDRVHHLSFTGRFTWGDNPEANLVAIEPVFDGQEELFTHLQSNALYYNQAIWSSLDGAALALLLSPYSFDNRPDGKPKPILESIDPTPVAVAGNYLVFRMHRDPEDTEDPKAKEWLEWLTNHGVNKNRVHQQVVPLPSGGVFAEAVLGRSNAAEKLDMTRFWNWQDSPIPDQATPIAPIQSGSRGTAEDVKPGNLSQPLVNIVGATPLPDPQGLNAAITAISNGNMFRDMSGLASIISLAQAGLDATSAGAGRASQQAGANMATIGQFQVEMVKALLPLLGAAMGIPIPPSGESASISNQGAKINQGRKLDEDKGKAREKKRSGSGSILVGGPNRNTTDGSGTEDDDDSGRSLASVSQYSDPQSHELAAFHQAIGANPGASRIIDAVLGQLRPATSLDNNGNWGTVASGISIAGPPSRTVDANEIVVLSASVPPGDFEVAWRDGGVPETGTGASFVTRFPVAGHYYVGASISMDSGAGASATVGIKVREPSGLNWCSMFKDSQDTAALSPPFRANVDAFLAALSEAKAKVRIETTYRPPERAYMMYWAWQIAKGIYKPNEATRMPGVDIAWCHRDDNGAIDLKASVAGAKAMISGEGFGMVHQAAKNSRHAIRRAIDMTISWTGDLVIKDASGNSVTISSLPRNGRNTELHTVGESYGVIKLLGPDYPHWSDTGT